MLALVLELVERRGGPTEGVAAGLVWMLGNLGGLMVTGVVGATLDRPALSFGLLAAAAALAVLMLARLRAPVAALHTVEAASR